MDRKEIDKILADMQAQSHRVLADMKSNADKIYGQLPTFPPPTEVDDMTTHLNNLAKYVIQIDEKVGFIARSVGDLKTSSRELDLSLKNLHMKVNMLNGVNLKKAGEEIEIPSSGVSKGEMYRGS